MIAPPKVLIADAISQRGVEELSRGNALEVLIKTGLSESELVGLVPEFAGLVVRSQTKVTADILSAGVKLRAVGRAGAGTNNIPVELLSKRGVPVFNAPGANANAVKELVLAGMFLAAVIAQVGYSLSKRATTDRGRFLKGAIAYSISTLLILVSIPWPFMKYGRPLFPSFVG